MTRILFLIPFIRSWIFGRSGSGPLGVEAHTPWLGHPSHADALPASSLSVPGQWAGAFSGTLSGNADAMDSGGSVCDDVPEGKTDVAALGVDWTAIMVGEMWSEGRKCSRTCLKFELVTKCFILSPRVADFTTDVSRDQTHGHLCSVRHNQRQLFNRPNLSLSVSLLNLALCEFNRCLSKCGSQEHTLLYPACGACVCVCIDASAPRPPACAPSVRRVVGVKKFEKLLVEAAYSMA